VEKALPIHGGKRKTPSLAVTLQNQEITIWCKYQSQIHGFLPKDDHGLFLQAIFEKGKPTPKSFAI
jgi:hypothetical protein